MKKIFFVFLLLDFSQANSQIVGAKDEPASKIKIIPQTSFYLEAGRLKTGRDLLVNSDFLAKPLGEREFETEANHWNFTLGISLPIQKFIYFDGGMTFLRNGEEYTWQSSENDSSFSYQTTYSYISMPLQLKIQGGNVLKYFLALGLQPQLLQSYRKNQQWTNEVNTKYSETIKISDDCNSFALSLISSAGIELAMSKYYGIKLSMQYRKQLSNTYLKTADYIHRARGFGFGFGLTRTL